MALFLQDPAKEKEECDKIMVEWRGPEALYLGHRRWAVSLDRPKSLVMSCLDQAGARKLPKAELPAIGIVEIPAGCAIQTDEWILQTSRRISSFSARNDSALIPQLRGVNWALAAVNDSTKLTEKLKDSSLHAAVESSWARIAGGAARASNFGKTIRALEEGDRARQENATSPQA
jgi:hypothetical protein